MAAKSHISNESGRETISQQGNVFTRSEIFSQLQNSVKNLIERSGLSKSEIAAFLGVGSSAVSMWLDRHGDGRNISLENAQKIIRLVRPQPRLILGDLEQADAAVEKLLEMQYGPQARIAKEKGWQD